MRRVVLVLLAALPVLAAEPEIAWESSLGRAKTLAQTEHKPIVVDVWATWCAPCKLMEKSTYPAAAVRTALGSFVPVKLDADANGSFLERYRIEAFPTVIVLDEEGWEIGRKRGYVSAEDLSSFLQDAAIGYSAYRGARPRKDDPVAMHTVGLYLARVGNPDAVGWLKKARSKAADPDLKRAVQETIDGFESAASTQRP